MDGPARQDALTALRGAGSGGSRMLVVGRKKKEGVGAGSAYTRSGMGKRVSSCRCVVLAGMAENVTPPREESFTGRIAEVREGRR